MKRDEFNVEKITNEENGLSLEFGSAQDEESTSYPDNKNKIRDEVNDNQTSNGTKRAKKEKKRRKKEESSKKDTNQSAESTISSSTATVATVVGASLVTVVSLSAMVGINLFFNGKCNMNIVEPSTNSIFYELDLTDINNDKCIIKLENNSYSEFHELTEGLNSGEFIDLYPSTNYRVSVVDVTYNNYVLYEDNVSTKELPLDTFIITFVTNGGSEIESQVVNSGDKASKPTDPTREDYNFEGWYSDSELTEEYDFDTPVISDLTLYAKWAIVTYTVTFISNGGTEVEPQVVNKGDAVLEPEPPSKEDYEFIGWYSDVDLTNEYDFALPVISNISLYAKWKEYNKYNVSFDANGGKGEMSPGEAKENEGYVYIIPDCDFEAPEAGKEFSYWTLGDDLETQYHPGDELILSSDVTLKANWATIICTISFVANNGTEETMEPVVLEYDAYFTMPDCDFSDPDEHKMFAGWLLDDDTEPMKGASWHVKGDNVLTAAWEDCYVVTYANPENEEEKAVVKVPVSEPRITLLDTCDFTIPTDYYLYSWIDENDNEYSLSESISLTDDITLKACFLENGTSFIDFDANGGTGSMSQIRTADASIELPECTFTAPEGFKFDHWYIEDEVVANEYYPGDSLTITEDNIELMAYWLPDASFKFHIDYFDTRSSSPTNELHYTLTYNDTYEKYVNGEFELVFSSSDGNDLTISNITLETSTSAGYSLDLTDYVDFFSNYDVLDYSIYGYAMKGEEKIRVNPIKGSINQANTQKTRFGDVYIDGVKVEDGATIPYFYRGNLQYIAISCDYNDYNGATYGDMFNLGFGSSGTGVPAKHGVQSTSPDDLSAVNNLVINNYTYSQLLASFTDLTYVEMSTEAPRVFGFAIDEESLFSDNTIKVSIAAAAYDGSNWTANYSDMGASDLRLVITPKNSAGSLTHLGSDVSFEIPFEPLSGAYTFSNIVINLDNADQLKKYFANYALDIKLIYHDTITNSDKEITQYTNYTFAYAG